MGRQTQVVESLRSLEKALKKAGLRVILDNWPFHIMVPTGKGLYSIYRHYPGRPFEVCKLTKGGEVDYRFRERVFDSISETVQFLTQKEALMPVDTFIKT